MNRIVTIFLIILLIILQYRLWFNNGGIIDMLRMKKQAAVVKHENDQLKERNQKLIQQVQQLKNNQNAVEVRARHELGMIKKGETFYQVVK